MEVYELGYLILPSIAEEAVSDVARKLKDVIASAGGAELASEEPIHIDLAYTMTKTIGASRYVVDDAYIGWVKFEAAPDKAEEIRDKVSLAGEVLRFILIKVPKETSFTFANARAKLAEKEEREEKKEETNQAVVQ